MKKQKQFNTVQHVCNINRFQLNSQSTILSSGKPGRDFWMFQRVTQYDVSILHFTFAPRMLGDVRGPAWCADRLLLSHKTSACRCQRPSCSDGRRTVNMSREESLRLNPVQQHQQHLTVGRETSSRRGGSRRSSWNNADDFDRRSMLSVRVDVDGVDGMHSRTHSIGKKPSGQSLKSAWRLKYQDFIPDKSITLKSEPFQ